MHSLLSVLFEEVVEFFELGGGDLPEQRGELVLPLLAVGEDRLFEWRAVEQHELDVQDRLLGLHVVGHFVVPGWDKTRV